MQLLYICSDQMNPYWNIAVENHLVASCRQTIVLYLWRNRRTVVIGQNQNPFSEVNVDALEGDGGFLMRRKTGGGAVYHDEGNINFSFVVPKELYDQRRQFAVIQRAVESFGLSTQLSGRNDILVRDPRADEEEGAWRKFSGNAFSKGRDNDLHHGTLLIKGNMEDMQRYLRPKPAKLQKHGVSSVRSRVANLAELNPAICADTLVPALRRSFAEEYGADIEEMPFADLLATPEVKALYAHFASEEWKYGSWRTFTAQRSAQFDWGGVELQLHVDEARGVITDVQIASDALDLAALDEARRLLTGTSVAEAPAATNPILRDILTLVYEQ